MCVCVPDTTSGIRFGYFLPESWCAKPAIDDLVRLWPNAYGQKASWCARITGPYSDNTTGLPPVAHFQTRLRSSTDGPDHFVQNQPGSDLILADCQVLAKRIRSGSKPVGRNHGTRFCPTLPSQSRSDADRIRHVNWGDLKAI